MSFRMFRRSKASAGWVGLATITCLSFLLLLPPLALAKRKITRSSGEIITVRTNSSIVVSKKVPKGITRYETIKPTYETVKPTYGEVVESRTKKHGSLTLSEYGKKYSNPFKPVKGRLIRIPQAEILPIGSFIPVKPDQRIQPVKSWQPGTPSWGEEAVLPYIPSNGVQ